MKRILIPTETINIKCSSYCEDKNLSAKEIKHDSDKWETIWSFIFKGSSGSYRNIHMGTIYWI